MTSFETFSRNIALLFILTLSFGNPAAAGRWETAPPGKQDAAGGAGFEVANEEVKGRPCVARAALFFSGCAEVTAAEVFDEFSATRYLSED
jgi:hypothetical protein